MSKEIASTPLAQFLNKYIRDDLQSYPAAFAKKIGLSQSQISRILYGEGDPLSPKETVRPLLANELKMTIDEFESKFSPKKNDKLSLVPKIEIKRFADLIRFYKDSGLYGESIEDIEKDIADQLRHNDNKNYHEVFKNEFLKKRMFENTEGQYLKWVEFIKRNADYGMLLLELSTTPPKIIGDWQFIPIENSTFSRIKQGKITETEIYDSDIPAMLSRKKEFHIFLLNFSINYEYISTKLIQSFFQSFIDSLINLIDDCKIQITDIITRPYSSFYQKLFSEYYFDKLPNTGINGADGLICSEGDFPLYYLDNVNSIITAIGD